MPVTSDPSVSCGNGVFAMAVVPQKLLLHSHFTTLLLSLQCLDDLPNGGMGSAKIRRKKSMPSLYPCCRSSTSLAGQHRGSSILNIKKEIEAD